MMKCVRMMPVGCMGVMSCFFIIAGFVLLGRLVMMLCCMGMVLRCLSVMFRCLFRHGYLSLGQLPIHSMDEAISRVNDRWRILT
jgi:hypothetical protein